VLYFNIIPVYNTINEILYYACFGQPIDGAETVNNQHVGCKHLENFLGTLFAQTNYFQEISSHIPTGMWRIDKKMNIVYANNVAASKFNLKADTNLLDHVMHSEHRYIKNMLKSCSPENLIHKMTFRVIAADTI